MSSMSSARTCARVTGWFDWAKEAAGTAKTAETMIAEIRYFTMTYLRRLFFDGDKQISFRVVKTYSSKSSMRVNTRNGDLILLDSIQIDRLRTFGPTGGFG